MTVLDSAVLPWEGIWGQAEAVQMLQRAVAHPETLAHAWLFTGPPGSGRSVLARSFAAALVADSGLPEAEREQVMRQVIAGTHPDVTVLRTERVIISIAEARALVERASFAPSLGRYRVLIVEDADRMAERTSNVLLKALEEPPEQTVWILCAPSDADLLPTIRSRVRTLRLREPEIDEVAQILVARTGADPELARQAARHAQRHIGMAQRLVSDEAARIRRDGALRAVLGVRGVGTAVDVAAQIIQAATDDAKALTAERDATERESLLRTLGVAAGQAVPPALRSQLKALEDDQAKRATRSLRDGIDRVLTDMQSLFRDIVMIQFGRTGELVNEELRELLEERAGQWTVGHVLNILDHLAHTRAALDRNVAPLLALESLLVTVFLGRKP